MVSVVKSQKNHAVEIGSTACVYRTYNRSLINNNVIARLVRAISQAANNSRLDSQL